MSISALSGTVYLIKKPLEYSTVNMFSVLQPDIEKLQAQIQNAALQSQLLQQSIQNEKLKQQLREIQNTPKGTTPAPNSVNTTPAAVSSQSLTISDRKVSADQPVETSQGSKTATNLVKESRRSPANTKRLSPQPHGAETKAVASEPGDY